MWLPTASSATSVNVCSSSSNLIADAAIGFPSIAALLILISSAFRTICFTASRTFSFTLSDPVKVRLAMSGTIRTAYSSGTICFGSFPGVLAKSNGFSAVKIVRGISESATAKAKKRICH